MTLDFDLPLVEGTITAGSALQKLRAQGISALVAQAPNGSQIYTAEALTRAIRHHGKEISVNRISGIETVSVPRAAPTVIGAILDQAQVRYGVLDIEREMVHLTSRFEDQVQELLRVVRVCTCKNNKDHVYLESDLRGSHTCQLDGSDLDCD